jgi:hypothetical protein
VLAKPPRPPRGGSSLTYRYRINPR